MFSQAKGVNLLRAFMHACTLMPVSAYACALCVCQYDVITQLYVSPHSMEQLDHCLEAAHLVVAAVEPWLSGVVFKTVQKSFRSSAALMLYLIAKLDSFQFSQDSSVSKQAGEMKARGLHIIHKVLMGWLQQSMLRDRFGGIYGQSLNNSKHELELKVDTRTHACTHASTCMCTHTHTHTHSTHTRTHTHTHTHTYTHTHMKKA